MEFDKTMNFKVEREVNTKGKFPLNCQTILSALHRAIALGRWSGCRPRSFTCSPVGSLALVGCRLRL